MKTAPVLAPPGGSTLFQTAARLDVPRNTCRTQLEPRITRETFAYLRLEAAGTRPKTGLGASRTGAVTRPSISFEVVRQTIISHTVLRQARIGVSSRPNGACLA